MSGVVAAVPARLALSPIVPPVGTVCAAPAAGWGDATAPPLADVCTSPFAVAAAALSAARLSLASSTVQAATASASAAVTIADAYLIPCLISPSVWVVDGEQGKRRAAASVRVGWSPRRAP